MTGYLKSRSLLIAWLVSLAILSIWTILSVKPITDLSQFLPRGISDQDQVLLSQVRAGVASRTLLMRIGIGDGRLPVAERLGTASRSLAERLIETGVFSLVANGDLSRIAHDTDPVLLAYRYLIGPTQNCSRGFEREVLDAAMKQRYDELISGIGMVDKQRLVADPTACYRHLLSGIARQDGPKLQDGIWVDAGGTHALFLVITNDKALDLTAQDEAVRTIEAAFADLTECQGLTLELAGPGYFAVASERQIKTETMVLSIIASILVALIIALAFRSTSLVILGLLPLASGILLGIVLVSSIYGFVHGITLGLGVTLLGVALDYPVHIFSHAQGSTIGRGLVIWSTLMLSMVSTILGYAALAWTNFEGLSQLGVLTASGLGVAALTSLYLLPLLLPKGYSPPDHSWLSNIQHWLPYMSPTAGIIILLLLLVGLSVMLSGRESPWETDIRRLSTVPQHEIEKDAVIRAELGAPDVARLLYLVGKDQAEVLTRLEAVTPDLEGLQQRGFISGFDNAALWLPSPFTQRARQAALPDPATLEANLVAANSGLPFRVERFAPFLEAVKASKYLAPLTASDLEGTLIGIRVNMLLSPLNDRWLGLVPLSEVSGDQATAALEDLAMRHGMTYLNLWQATTDLIAGYFSETLTRCQAPGDC